MLRAHEHLIILGAFARARHVSTPLQSATSFFLQKFYVDFCYFQGKYMYVFFHPLVDVIMLTIAVVVHVLCKWRIFTLRHG